MKPIKRQLEKGIALLLALVLASGSFLPISARGQELRNAAGENARSKPRVTAFASKDELMTVFDLDGVDDTVGKLLFGSVPPHGDPMEWYIAGTDTGVSGNNIIIFAASSILSLGVTFESDYNKNKTYDSSWGCSYDDESSISEVHPNHYGASHYRYNMHFMFQNEDGSLRTSYFSQAEQDLMNETTVTTKDTKNDVPYKTTDKIYPLQGKESEETLWAGSDDSVAIVREPYWESGNEFWLRTPEDNYYNQVLFAKPDYGVSHFLAYEQYALRPASNLDLSNVLFASAASAASSGVSSGLIEEDTAMTLRLDGNDKKIGTVMYNWAEGEIAAQKDSEATKTVSLVVQGNDGTNDWYYSAVVSDTVTVTTDEIKNALGLTTDISLEDCRIWLEIQEDCVTYARMAVAEKVYRSIADVAITGMRPVAGDAFDSVAVCETEGIVQEDLSITYTTSASGTDVPVTETVADWNTTYRAWITLQAIDSESEGYVFADTVTVTIDGEAADSITHNADGTLTVAKEFTTGQRFDPTISYGADGYSGTYDGLPHTIDVTVDSPEEASITYSTDQTAYSEDKPKFTDVGTHTVYYKIEKDGYDTVTDEETVTIDCRELTILADGQTVRWGNDIDQTKYTVSGNGLAAGDCIADITLTPGTRDVTDSGKIAAGNARIVNAADSDVTDNYHISYIEGTLRITHNDTLAPGRIEAEKIQTDYTTGDVLNVDDLTVTVYYEDGYSEIVTDFITNVTSIDMTKAGEKNLAVTYKKNYVSLMAMIPITVREQDVSEILQAAPQAGTYEANQLIELGTSAEDVDIYYTTDGSMPAFLNGEVTNGTLFTDKIPVTGINGQSVTMTICAIAVKDGVPCSGVAEFAYHINLSAQDNKDSDTPGVSGNDIPDDAGEAKGEDTTPDAASGEAESEPASEPETAYRITADEIEKNSMKIDTKMTVQWKGNRLAIKWGKVSGADGYDIFVTKRGKKLNEKSPAKTVKGQKTSATLSKLAGKKLTDKKGYRIKVGAYKLAGGKKVYIGYSRIYVAAGKRDKTYTDAKKVKAAKKTITLKKGRTAKIRVTVVKQSKSKKLLPKKYGAALRYSSTDKRIATVTSKGKIKAKKKGTCYIYITALNGVRARVKVRVR